MQMINVGVQYYRAPFPENKYWENDLKLISESGLNTVQLWAVWAWIEPSPGEFIFDDYDRLIELADKNGLKVVLSSIAAVQPYWIHREVPGSEMVTNLGNKVVSSNRVECHFGLTPGGCFDHPGVWQRIEAFLSRLVERYRGVGNLAGWDIWNEIRWNEQADGLVCYCPYTINAFHTWLKRSYGDLDGLNTAWHRRYRSWEDVLPGKATDRPYTEMMAFQDFISRRSVDHGNQRYDLVKAMDPDRPATLHGAFPTVLHGMDRYPLSTALHRGNDWDFADHLDGIGCSSFPVWQNTDDADYIARIDFLRSAARGKRIWLSEVQGGRASTGFTVHKSVKSGLQQRWIWSGIGNGADTVLFWCWRDEVFGRESSGYGMSGSDGLAEDRLNGMKKTGALLKSHTDLLENYQIDQPRVGIFFSPQSYYLHWAQDGNAEAPMRAVQGYARACIRNNIPYVIIEETHLDSLKDLKLLIMPRALVVDSDTEKAIVDYVHNGGMLVCESETGAFCSNGLYNYPADRFLARLAHVEEIGRRLLEDVTVEISLGGETLHLPVNQWLTPLDSQAGKILASHREGPIMTKSPAGRGHVVSCGFYSGEPYFEGSSLEVEKYKEYTDDFERFVLLLAKEADVYPAAEILDPDPPRRNLVHIKTGTSKGAAVVFVFCENEKQSVRLRFPKGIFDGQIKDLISGIAINTVNTTSGVECTIPETEWGVAVLTAT